MDQDNGTFKRATHELTLDRVAHVPKLGRAITCFQQNDSQQRSTRRYASTQPPPPFDPVSAARRSISAPYAQKLAFSKSRPAVPLTTARSMVTARTNPRHIMEFHRVLGHPSEEITRGTARVSVFPLTGTWSPWVQCSKSRVRRYAVPKSTESCTNERAERFFIDITGPFCVTSLGGNRYAMLCVDDFIRFKFIRFLKHRSDAAKELHAGIKIGTIGTDGGEEFEGEFHSLL